MNLIKKTFFFIVIILFCFSITSIGEAEQITTGIYICASTTVPCVTPVAPTTTPAVSTTTAPQRLKDYSVTGIPAILPSPINVSTPDVFVTGSGAIISFASSIPAKHNLYLGTTEQLEIGLISSGDLSLEHQILIPSLSPNKKYFYRVDLFADYGATKTIGVLGFQTLQVLFKPIFPVSVEKLTFRSSGSSVDIKWSPISDTNNYLRIVRSYKFYPLDPYDGIPLYEGTGSSFSDSYHLEKGVDYFYSLFVCNKEGVCSFGQTFKIKIPSHVSVSTSKSPSPVHLAGDIPTVGEIKVFSGGKEVSVYQNNYYLDSRLPVSISLRSKASAKDIESVNIPLTEENGIRSLIVSFTEPGELPQSFQAKYNPKNGFFETSPFSLRKSASYIVSVDIYDYKGNMFVGPEFVLNSIDRVTLPVDMCHVNWNSLIFCYGFLVLEISLVIIALLLFLSYFFRGRF